MFPLKRRAMGDSVTVSKCILITTNRNQCDTIRYSTTIIISFFLSVSSTYTLDRGKIMN